MAYTNLELLRKNLADEYQNALDTQTGDGSTKLFKLSHGRIKEDSYVVSVDSLEVDETTDYTIDTNAGTILFVSAPADGDEIEVQYQFSAFSDDELGEFLTLEGGVNNAWLRAVDILLSDTARRFDYSAGQSELKPSQVFDNLLKLREKVILPRIKDSGEGTGATGLTIVKRHSKYYENENQPAIDLSKDDFNCNDDVSSNNV